MQAVSLVPCAFPLFIGLVSIKYMSQLPKDAADAGFDDEFIYKELDLPENKRQLRTSELLMEEGQKYVY